MKASFSTGRVKVIAAFLLLLALAVLIPILIRWTSSTATPPLPPPASAEFRAPPRTPDLSGTIADNLAAMPAVAGASAPAPQPLVLDDPIMSNLARYGTPVSKQALPVGGLTAWTVVSKSGNPVQLYTTADGKAVMVGTVWDIATGENLSDRHAGTVAPAAAAAPAAMAQAAAPAMPKDNLVSGKGALPAALSV